MPKHLYLLILFTFFVGAVSGMYVYFISRDTTETGGGSELLDTEGYEIVAAMYGGCERIGCTSLRIIDDGSYVYLVSREGGTRYDQYEDRLSARDRAELNDLMAEAPFDELEVSRTGEPCPIIYDGVAYRFMLNIGGAEYEFDSCTHEILGTSLFDFLIDYLDGMAITYSEQ